MSSGWASEDLYCSSEVSRASELWPPSTPRLTLRPAAAERRGGVPDSGILGWDPSKHQGPCKEGPVESV